MTNKKQDNTEEKILSAAQNVFIRKGMDGARMQEIADEAGINKALLHYYFRSKQQLFHATFESVFSKIIPNVMRMVQSDQPIDEKLEFFIANYIDVLMKNPFLPTFILKEIHQDPEFLAELIRSSGLESSKVVEMFKKEIEKETIRAMDPRDLLISILSLIIFPIASRPLLSLLFFDDDQKGYMEFIETRKVTVKEFVLNSILIK